MKNCQATDCPAPTIEYENLYKLGNLDLCPFCFTKQNVTEKVYISRKTIQKPSKGLKRLSVRKKDTFLKSNQLFFIKEPLIKPKDLIIWKEIITEWKIRIPSKIMNHFLSINRIDPLPEARAILRSDKGSLLLFKRFQNVIDLTEEITKYSKQVLTGDLIEISLLNTEPQSLDYLTKYFEIKPREEILFLTSFSGSLYPLTELINTPHYEHLNKTLLTRNLAIIWLLWILGYSNILNSLFIEIENDNVEFKIFFFQLSNFNRNSLNDTEKQLFNNFVLYIPFIFDNYKTFEEGISLIRQLVKKNHGTSFFTKKLNEIANKFGEKLPVFSYHA